MPAYQFALWSLIATDSERVFFKVSFAAALAATLFLLPPSRTVSKVRRCDRCDSMKKSQNILLLLLPPLSTTQTHCHSNCSLPSLSLYFRTKQREPAQG